MVDTQAIFDALTAALLERLGDEFDQHLRTFLTERSVELNDFTTLDDLQAFLGIQ